jgi:integrase
MGAIHRLNKSKIEAAQKTGKDFRLNDGRGLYLVRRGQSEAWHLVFELDGKRKEMSLGSAHALTIAAAREAAEAVRAVRKAGGDPIAERRAARENVQTFAEVVAKFLSNEKHGANEKHRKQWRTTLGERYCPSLQSLKINRIDKPLISLVLDNLVKTPETRKRVRARLFRVFEFAEERGLITHNPVPVKLRRVENAAEARPHRALPPAQVPAFYRALVGEEGAPSMALQMLILTAARTGEIVGATWSEIDLIARVWTIPGARMKAGEDHTVPLSAQAISLLESLPRGGSADPLFPGRPLSARKGTPAFAPLSNMAMLMLTRRLGDKCTPHGFRASFKDWGGETERDRELIELSLAHAFGTKVERSYRRSTLIKRRAVLMQAWADFVTEEQGDNVLTFRGRA